ncbi:hypothetical protein PENTCL1PPCAC_8000, partial [Pristionchus entomophagus]
QMLTEEREKAARRIAEVIEAKENAIDKWTHDNTKSVEYAENANKKAQAASEKETIATEKLNEYQSELAQLRESL